AAAQNAAAQNVAAQSSGLLVAANCSHCRWSSGAGKLPFQVESTRLRLSGQPGQDRFQCQALRWCRGRGKRQTGQQHLLASLSPFPPSGVPQRPSPGGQPDLEAPVPFCPFHTDVPPMLQGQTCFSTPGSKQVVDHSPLQLKNVGRGK
ncbi:unnamed protein product, partial [Ixodes persulcatus]